MQIKYNCKIENKLTTHTVRKVSDTLPKYMHVIECNGCGHLTMAVIDMETAYHGDL